MKETKKTYFKVLLNLLTAIAVVALIIILVPKAIAFFMPFVIGWIISLMASPIVKFFEDKLKIKRKAGTAIVIVLVLAIVIALVYFVCSYLIGQAISFVEAFPSIWKSICIEFDRLKEYFAGMYDKLPANVQAWLNDLTADSSKYFSDLSFVSDKVTTGGASIGHFVSSIPDAIIATVMTLLSSYLFVAEKDYFGNAFERYLPKSLRYNLDVVKRSFKKAIGGYFKAQFRIEIRLFIITALGLLFLRIDYAVIIALLISFMDFLPVFGAGAVMVPWGIIKIVDGSYYIGIGILVIWAVAQVVRSIIEPKIVGESVGISSIPTLFLMFVGYSTNGVLGMILAVPIGIILKNMYEEGIFDTTLESAHILIAGFNRYRQLNSKDHEIIEEYEREVETDYKSRQTKKDKK